MEEQKQIIEQVFKNAFDEFTPDVSPKVWSGISQQLAQPVVPSPQPSGSLVKMGAAKLGSVSTWIVGGIAAVAVTAGVLMYQQKEASNNVATISPAVTTEVKSDGDEKTITAPMISEQPVQTNEVNSNLPVMKSHTNQAEVAEDLSSKGSDQTLKVNSSVKSEEEVPVAQTKSVTHEVTASKEKENTIAESQTIANPESNNSNEAENKVAPLILINSTAGFAPLQVACLLNKEGMSGDWDFGDGIAQMHANSVSHKYTRPGTYTLQCNAGESKLTKTIEVIGQISTAFSPNGDGINDYFFVDGNSLSDFSLHIFDRNGRTVADLKNIAEKWDGRMSNGEAAPAGTYFYELKATTVNEKEINQKGTVGLFR